MTKRIRRVIVGLDPLQQSRALLEAAAELAGEMQAELLGLFVENQDLLHFAGLPFAREVGFESATRRALDVGSMERTLRALAKEARQALEAVASPTRVQWSFRVVRGVPAAELLAAAEESDLVIANLEAPPDVPSAVSFRVIRAGDVEALRAALEEAGGGVLVLAGADAVRVGETLRQAAGRGTQGAGHSRRR
ncbi:MAG TPA: universal stress protein [Burkholderiales bacterium]|jgi:nucleotide-binding universal stress UspA family protein